MVRGNLTITVARGRELTVTGGTFVLTVTGDTPGKVQTLRFYVKHQRKKSGQVSKGLKCLNIRVIRYRGAELFRFTAHHRYTENCRILGH